MDTAPEFDPRYSITLEFTGYPTKRYVLRFCREWLECFPNADEAIKARSFSIVIRNLALKHGWWMPPDPRV